MKKMIAMVLALMLLVSLTACQGADDGKLVVGVCQLIQHDALDAATEGFCDALKEEFGDNIEIVVKNASGDPATCSTIANAFVADGVDLIMANATPALQAAAAATDTIPILGTSVTEYGVALELEDVTNGTGKNISGTSDLAPLDEQAAMINEWFPDAKTVGLLYCSAEANSTYQVETVSAELEAKGYSCNFYTFTDSNDIQMVTNTAAAECDVIYVPTDNAAAAAKETIYEVCSAQSVPVIAGEEGICAGCGVATLSISYYDLGYTTGTMAIEILKNGKDVSTMPIEYAPATKKYNAKICQELGLEPLEGYVAIED